MYDFGQCSAAKLLEKHEAPCLYRVHDEPDPERLSQFRQFLQDLGIESQLSNEPTPQELTDALIALGERPEKELIKPCYCAQ